MISLCLNKKEVSSALKHIGSKGYFETLISSYLEAYGTSYNFCEFYLQYVADGVCALILRYNSYIYLILNEDADKDELSAFLFGFKDSVLYCPFNLFPEIAGVKHCYVMSAKGEFVPSEASVKETTDSPKIIAELVAKGMSSSLKDDFFLNTSHQSRHNTLRVFSYFKDQKAVSAVGVTREYSGVSVITFVFTDEYFRGNGYSKNVLKAVCSLYNCEYQLLCEEHNVEFYKKCGFRQTDICYEICL